MKHASQKAINQCSTKNSRINISIAWHFMCKMKRFLENLNRRCYCKHKTKKSLQFTNVAQMNSENLRYNQSTQIHTAQTNLPWQDLGDSRPIDVF
jgi:hypothetical protein